MNMLLQDHLNLGSFRNLEKNTGDTYGDALDSVSCDNLALLAGGEAASVLQHTWAMAAQSEWSALFSAWLHHPRYRPEMEQNWRAQASPFAPMELPACSSATGPGAKIPLNLAVSTRSAQEDASEHQPPRKNSSSMHDMSQQAGTGRGTTLR